MSSWSRKAEDKLKTGSGIASKEGGPHRGGVAQLGEHLPCKQGVKSSNLSISTRQKQLNEFKPKGGRRVLCEAVRKS